MSSCVLGSPPRLWVVESHKAVEPAPESALLASGADREGRSRSRASRPPLHPLPAEKPTLRGDSGNAHQTTTPRQCLVPPPPSRGEMRAEASVDRSARHVPILPFTDLFLALNGIITPFYSLRFRSVNPTLTVLSARQKRAGGTSVPPAQITDTSDSTTAQSAKPQAANHVTPTTSRSPCPRGTAGSAGRSRFAARCAGRCRGCGRSSRRRRPACRLPSPGPCPGRRLCRARSPS